MFHRFLFHMFLFSLAIAVLAAAQPSESNAGSNYAGSNYSGSSPEASYDGSGANWDWNYSSDEGGGGTSYLGVDIADVSTERLAQLKLKEEHGAEITMVDQDAPAGKAGLHEHDVIVSVNGTMVESAAQLRRMIKETPAGRVVNLGISRDGQPLTIKVQLADRHKSMSWSSPKMVMPEIPEIPPLPDFDVPVSVVMVHSSLRSGLMVENISAQLGDFFGVKDGKGVLVRSVEKGSRGEKAGFHAGDVVVKVNNQPVHDTSDFTHALRSSASGTASVTVMREKREQNLTLTLPEKKDSGTLLEDSFDDREFTAEMEQAINMAGAEIARLGPDLSQLGQEQAERWAEMDRDRQERQEEIQEQRQEQRQEMRERQKERVDREKERPKVQLDRLRRLTRDWAEI